MDFITTNQKNLQLKQVLEPTVIQQSQDTDIKHQDIEYCMCNRNKIVYYEDHVQVDLQLAITEFKNLDWTYLKNGISFHNNKTDQSLFCHRIKEDSWLAQTPIRIEGIWTGYQWVSYPDTIMIINVIRLYFEEMPWFHTLSWGKVRWTNDFGV